MENRTLSSALPGAASVDAAAPARRGGTSVVARDRPAGSTLETWILTGLGGMVLVGAYHDGWAHNRDLTEDFFTIYHAILYSALNLTTLFVLGLMVRNHRRGYPWVRSLPRGYEVALLGLALFTVFGLVDLLWHLAFGIEQAAQSLVSPPHLALSVGGGMIPCGALAWAYRQSVERDDPATRYLVPVQLAFFLSATTFITQFYHAWGRTAAAAGYFTQPGIRLEEAPFTLEIASVILQTTVLIGLVTLFLRHRTLPPGSITIILGINAALLTYMKSDRLATGAIPLFLAALAAGLLIDALLWRLQPTAARRAQLRVFAFVAPVILYALYYLTLQLAGGGIGWVIHLWAGGILIAGITGWITSFAVVPPAALELSASER